MTATVHLLVVNRVLIVVVGLQGELGTAYRALEATRVEKRKVFQGTHPVDLIDSLSTSQTRALVEVRPIHDTRLDGPPCPVFSSRTGVLRLLVLITARCSLLVRRSVSLSIRATLKIKGLDQGIEKLPLTAGINTRRRRRDE